MNAPARITQRPLVRPSYTNAPVTLETFERWAIVNYSPLRRYWLELQESAGANGTAGEFVEWAQCQYDIAKSSPEPQQPMQVCSPLVEGSHPTAGIRTADAGTSYPVTCRARYYDAATKILEDELRLFTHDNADELGLLIEQWMERKRANWEPR